MKSRFTRVRELSSWRRLALHMWHRPADPTVYGNLELDMGEALAYLDRANRDGDEPRLTVTHLVVKGIARALAETPDANAIVSLGRLYRRERVDIYCQVATDGGADLSGVKIEDADLKSLRQIAAEMEAKVEALRRSRDESTEATKRALARVPDGLLGLVLRAVAFLTYGLRLDLSRFGIAFDQFGGAMVSNVGGFGVGHGLAPLVPASYVPIVLLVGEITDRPAVLDGHLTIAPKLNLGCTFDHRLIDGYQASRMASTVSKTVTGPAEELGPPNRSN